MTVQQARDRVEAVLVAAGWVRSPNPSLISYARRYRNGGPFSIVVRLQGGRRLGHVALSRGGIYVRRVDHIDHHMTGRRWPERMAAELMRIAEEAR